MRLAKKHLRIIGMIKKTEKKIIKNLKDLEKVIVLMKKHKIDNLDVEGIKILITKHESAPVPVQNNKNIDEELEFWSLAPQ